MYFGSVKFFKHLILTVVFGWIGVATVLAVYFGVKCHMLENSSEGSGGSIPRGASVGEVMDRLHEMGYSDEEISGYLTAKDASASADVNRQPVPDFDGDETAAVQTEPASTEVTVPETAATDEEFIPYVPEEDDAYALPVQTEEIEGTYFEPVYIGTQTEAAYTEPAVTYAVQTQPVQTQPAYTEPVQTKPAVTEQTRPVQTQTEAVYIPENEKPVTDSPYNESIEDFAELYPDLYVQHKAANDSYNAKTVYLAFEGGPSPVTTYDTLYILSRQGIKASFFLSAGKDTASAELIYQIADAGHTLGISCSGAYSTAEACLADINTIFSTIFNTCGVKPEIYTLSGVSGSVRTAVVNEMTRRGFILYSPNADSGDRDTDASWQSIHDTSVINVSVNSAKGVPSVLLFHNTADDYTSVITVEDVIIDLAADGYSFRGIAPAASYIP